MGGLGELEARGLACEMTFFGDVDAGYGAVGGRRRREPEVMVPGPQPMSRISWCGWMWGRRKAASLVAAREVWERVTDSW